jgi:hypothetical protein
LFYQKKIKEGFLINNRMKPRRLGKMTNGPAQVIERTWSDVTTNHDV